MLEAVTFDSWKGGEFGLLQSREAGRSQDQMFGGKNVMRYRDGLLGPRPGVRNLGITGLGNGAIKALGGGSAGTVVVIGSTVYSFDPTSYGSAATAWTMTASITDTLTKPAEMAGGFAVEYVLCYGGNVYKLNNATHTCTLVAAIPAGRCACFYQDRLVVGGPSSNPGRLYYSNPGASGWETFPASSYYDLPGVSITYLAPFRAGLLVGTASGAFIYITGTLGANAIVRTLSTQASPPDTAKAVKLDSDEILYLGKQRTYPTKYNGAVHSIARHLRWAGENYADDTSSAPTFRAIKLIGPDDWLLLSGGTNPDADNLALNRALMHYEGVASYQQWEQDIKGWGVDMGGGKTLLAKDGDGSHPPVFYVFFTELPGTTGGGMRPGFTTDGDSRPGDDSTTPLDAHAYIAQWFPQDNNDEFLVRYVVVDFKKWNTGSATNNHFDVTTRAVNRYNAVQALASAAQSWDEAGAAVSLAGGENMRYQFGFGDQGQGHGFEIYFDNIKGIALRSVTVLFERMPSRT